MKSTFHLVRSFVAVAFMVTGPNVVWADDREALTRLEEKQIVNLLSGATLYGKYIDGRPDWAEQTAVTGQLFDVEDDWAEVGSWTTVADMACYNYFNKGGVYCFEVYAGEDGYYFYSAGTEELVAYTTRIDRPPMM